MLRRTPNMASRCPDPSVHRPQSYVALVYAEQPVFTRIPRQAPHKSLRHISGLMLSTTYAHEMLHRGDRRTLTTKQVRETEAEAVAFVVCQAIGLETGTASADYVTVKVM
jgi:hypothetical protein